MYPIGFHFFYSWSLFTFIIISNNNNNNINIYLIIFINSLLFVINRHKFNIWKTYIMCQKTIQSECFTSFMPMKFKNSASKWSYKWIVEGSCKWYKILMWKQKRIKQYSQVITWNIKYLYLRILVVVVLSRF